MKLKKKKKGCFRVKFSATDICDADPTVVALLNGVSVTNGQLVKLIHDDGSSDDRKLKKKLKRLKKKWRKHYRDNNNSNGCRTWRKW